MGFSSFAKYHLNGLRVNEALRNLGLTKIAIPIRVVQLVLLSGRVDSQQMSDIQSIRVGQDSLAELVIEG
jgi:hypothetical protein